MKKEFNIAHVWVFLLFIFRLHGITNPPLETSHHWRQATVAMVARNLVTDNYDVLHPRMDTAGELSGITGMEFPLLNLLIAFMITIAGPAHWYGRLIVLFFSTFGLISYHSLIERRMNKTTAYYSTILLSVSLWFMYSRKIMPDVFSISLVIIGLERIDFYIDRPRQYRQLIVGCLFIALGLLSKITSGCLLAVLPIFLHRTIKNVKFIFFLLVLVLISCTPALWWYFEWVPRLVKDYGYWHFFMGKPLRVGLGELMGNLNRTFDNFYFDAMRYSGFIVFLFGFYHMISRKLTGLIGTFCLISCAFSYVMLRSGNTFWMHAYYVLPFIPAMTLVAGAGMAALKRKYLAPFLLAIVIIEGIMNQYHDFRISPSNAYMLSLEQDVKTIIPANSLVIINSGNIPTPMYFSARRGWTISNVALNSASTIDSLRALGAEYCILVDRASEKSAPWSTVLSRDEYTIQRDISIP
ncbi:MAG: glycosyltransferase family 39 protein [Flavobacteriales bacterium]|nr:glycosyltransferase family 39 protein [Flavobacteriales bacterium]